jgi:hypothetical protein
MKKRKKIWTKRPKRRTKILSSVSRLMLKNSQRAGSIVAFCCALCLMVAFAMPLALAAERERKDYALIFGTVWGADQQPVAGANVRIRRADQKKAKWQMYSDRRGEFAQRLPAEKADYVVWAEVKGKKGPAAESKCISKAMNGWISACI